jgi:hypothetical protein
LSDTTLNGQDRVGLAANPGAPVVYTDDFERPNSTNLGSMWDEATGNWLIKSGGVGLANNGVGGLRFKQDLGTNNMWAQATLGEYGGGQLGIVLRFSNTAFTGFSIEIADGRAKLIRAVNGEADSQNSSIGPSHSPKKGEVYRAEVEGNKVRLYINGQLFHSWTDNSFPNGSRSGLHFNEDSQATWADFATGPLGSSGPQYVSSGSIMSEPINYSQVPVATGWGAFGWDENEVGGSVSTQLYYSVGAACDTLVPNTDLPGNSSGFSSGPIDISGLSTTTYSQICLKASLSGTGNATPYLEEWWVDWQG